MSFLLVAAFLVISVSTVRTMVSPLSPINAAPPAHAADMRSVRIGATTIWGHRPHLNRAGVQLTTVGIPTPADGQQVAALLIDSQSGVTIRLENGRVVAITGAIRHRGVLCIETPAGSFDLENPILTFDPTLSTARLENGAGVPADSPSLVLDDLSVQYRFVDDQVIISTDNVRLSAAWADAAGVASAASLSIAGVLITLDARQGTAEPTESFERSLTSDTSGSADRGLIGPDIIVMRIPHILSYGSTMTCSGSGTACSIDASSGISDCRTCSVRGCSCQTDADCKTCTVSGEPCFDDLQCGEAETCDVVESCIPSGDSCNVPVSAFSIATRSCNIGDEDANWNGSTNAHPIISQNMFRLKDGRFEQIGMAWVKHGFASINLNDSCGDCQLPQNPSSQLLYVGCSDPYSTSLNGEQANMGPRSQIDAHTGVFPFPYTRPCEDLDLVIARRLQVHDADLDTAQNNGALYFVEAQYVAADEAQAGNGDNTVSYRRIFVQSLVAAMSPTILTEQQKAGIRAWADTDPDVTEIDIRVPGEGLLILATTTTELGNGAWRYEYALQNVNSARSIRSFSLPLPTAAEVTEIGFHDVDYHSGEPFDGTDWAAQATENAIAWSTDTFAENANANALRWGTLYNFRFTTNAEPAMTTLTLGLFRPGSPSMFTVTVPGPALDLIDCNDNLIADSCDVDCQAAGCDPPCGTSIDCNDNGVPDECEADCQPNGIADTCDISEQTSEDCNDNLVPDECEQDCDGDGIPSACDDDEDTDDDGIDDCADLCPNTIMALACDCPPFGMCCYPPEFGGFCVGPIAPENCLPPGVPDCIESELCRDGCLLGDWDNDGDLDLRDAAGLQRCFSGPTTIPGFLAPGAECLRVFDYDMSGGVDLDDHGRFESRMANP